MENIKLDCECCYCKKAIKADLMKVLFFRKIKCDKCENVHAIVEKSNRHGSLPGYIAALVGFLCTVWMSDRGPLFFCVFTVVVLLVYFILRYYLYATKRFKVYLTKWYR